jgi:hypothetical protein
MKPGPESQSSLWDEPTIELFRLYLQAVNEKLGRTPLQLSWIDN